MTMVTRRRFVQAGVAGVVCAREMFRPEVARATPLGLPLGLQLYSVREQLPGDFAGTLNKLGQMGYREVEGADVAGLYKKPASGGEAGGGGGGAAMGERALQLGGAGSGCGEGLRVPEGAWGGVCDLRVAGAAECFGRGWRDAWADDG